MDMAALNQSMLPWGLQGTEGYLHFFAYATRVDRDEQAAVDNSQSLEGNAPVTKRRTPPRIEALLCDYNSRGITKWNDILDLLKQEVPPITIKRSTLGEYLKECQLGTSRRNKMDDNEMRQIVIDELAQPTNRKRGLGVRAVWSTLKSKGHHIKRDFVEKVMKDVDPTGFPRRRPKWRTPMTIDEPTPTAQLPTAQPFPPFTSGGSLLISQDTFPSLPENFRMVHAALPSQMPSLDNTLPPPNTSQKDNSQEIESHMSLPLKPVHPLLPYIRARSQRPGENDTVGEDWNTSGDATNRDHLGNISGAEIHGPVFVSNAPEETGQPDIPRSIMSGHGEDATVEGGAEDDNRDDDPGSDNASVSDDILESFDSAIGPTEAAAGTKNPGSPTQVSKQRDCDEDSLMTPAALGRQRLEAIAREDRTGQRAQIQRLQLQNTLDDLFTAVDDWYARPVRDANPEMPTMSGVPASDVSFGTGSGEASGNVLGGRHRYAPDYTLSEDQVTQDALFFALAFRRTLSCPKTWGNVIAAAEQLRGLRGRLKDIGMGRKCLETAKHTYLNVLEVASRASYRPTWILEELWQCASECLMFDGPFSIEYLAQKAADALQDVIHHDPRHSDFYRAAKSRFDARLLSTHEETMHALKQSLVSLMKTVTPNSPHEHLAELMRAMTKDGWALDDDEMAKQCLDYLLPYADTLASDLALAALLPKLLWTIHYWFDDDDVIHKAQSLTTIIIERLPSFRNTRPSLVDRVLVQSLETQADIFEVTDHCQEALQTWEKAIAIQRRVARYGDGRDAVHLACYMLDTIDKQLRLRKWQNFLKTATDFVEFSELAGSSFTEFASVTARIGWILYYCQKHLASTCDPQLCAAAMRLVKLFRSAIGPRDSEELFKLSEVLSTAADVRREQGEFFDALRISHDAARTLADLVHYHGRGSHSHVAILAGHAQLLADNNEYEEAESHIQRATLKIADFVEPFQSWNENNRTREQLGSDVRADQLVSLGVTLLPMNSRIQSDINTILQASKDIKFHNSTPCWLRNPGDEFKTSRVDIRAWILLIRTVRHCTISWEEALASAQESLDLLSKYWEDAHTNVEPQAGASVKGHQFILLCLLGRPDDAHTALSRSTTLYRSVLISKPHMARLPLLVFLQILIMLFRKLAFLRFTIPQLQEWKKSVYSSSTSFFEEFISFLQLLPDFIHSNSVLDEPRE